MSRHLHIVCLDVPWPADYGGAIDMMNRIISLKQAGILIHLHYFSYNERGMPNELNGYCERIHVYPRKKGREGFTGSLPYIVSSRMDPELLKNLAGDTHPVLLEGLHTTGFLPQLDLTKRRVVVRLHNDEHRYYAGLARNERSLLRRIYFGRESRLLKKYQHQLPQNIPYACISEEDARILREEYGLPHAFFLPAFPSWQEVKPPEGTGNLCLYHGNLSVPENEAAALWLLRKVFMKTRKPFVIAGKNPSKRLVNMAHLCQHTCLVANPTETELNDLIRKAHINVLPGMQSKVTGVRLKLLHALYEGKHCIVNEAMVSGSGLEDACHIAGSADAFSSVIMQLYHQPFTEEETRLREKLLGDRYSNKKNTESLIRYLW